MQLAIHGNAPPSLSFRHLAMDTMSGNDDFRIRVGRIHAPRAPRTKPFLAQALQAAQKADGLSRGRSSSNSRFGCGRAASLAATRFLNHRDRSAMVKARVVRRTRSPGALRAHIGDLKRDGVARDGSPGKRFDVAGDDAEGRAFAERFEGDRYHFRFIVSSDDAGKLGSLRSFTRELMDQASHGLVTKLDWVAVDHWNTEHPHTHILVRGRADNGSDLVTSRDYIGKGLCDVEERLPGTGTRGPASSALSSRPRRGPILPSRARPLAIRPTLARVDLHRDPQDQYSAQNANCRSQSGSFSYRVDSPGALRQRIWSGTCHAFAVLG
jgi:hypothetical protein